QESLAHFQNEYHFSLRARAEQDIALPEHVGLLWHLLECRSLPGPASLFMEVALRYSESQGDLARRGRRFPRSGLPCASCTSLRDLLDDRCDAEAGGRLSEAAEAVPNQQQLGSRDR